MASASSLDPSTIHTALNLLAARRGGYTPTLSHSSPAPKSLPAYAECVCMITSALHPPLVIRRRLSRGSLQLAGHVLDEAAREIDRNVAPEPGFGRTMRGP